MKITDSQLKRSLLQLIGDSIDETIIRPAEDPEHASFVEMDERVIHYAGDCGDRYFRVDLVEVDGETYFDLVPEDL